MGLRTSRRRVPEAPDEVETPSDIPGQRRRQESQAHAEIVVEASVGLPGEDPRAAIRSARSKLNGQLRLVDFTELQAVNRRPVLPQPVEPVDGFVGDRYREQGAEPRRLLARRTGTREASAQRKFE